ncbi:hypothetical protein pb186bvf_006003 [Paramecium bursaria]
MKKQITQSNLKITFSSISQQIEKLTDFQNYIPESTNNLKDSMNSFSDYEPSNQSYQQEEEQNYKSRIHQQADIYLNQLKNYFGTQKLQLAKFNRKQYLSQIQNLTNYTDHLITYYDNLEKSFEPMCQISILQKIQKYQQTVQDVAHKIIINNIHQDMLFSIFQIHHTQANLQWQDVKIQIRQIQQVFIQQKQFIKSSAQPQILQMQRAYLEEYKELKKQKTEISIQYNDIYRKQQKFVGEKTLMEQDLDSQRVEFKDLKSHKADPQKLIKMEMNIKLLDQQIKTIKQKINRYNLDSQNILKQSTELDIKLQQFLENWSNQLSILFMSVIRSLLQSHFENYQQFCQSFKNLFQPMSKQISKQLSKQLSQDEYKNMTKQKTVLDESDPIRLMKREKEEIQEIFKLFQDKEELFNQFDKQDQEIIIIQQIKESLINACNIEIRQLQGQFQGSQWVLIPTQDRGLIQNNTSYRNALQSIINIETNFREQKTKFVKEFKEISLIVKERQQQLTYIFNCILKDTDRFNPNKSRAEGYKDYQKHKDEFKNSFQNYKQESCNIISKLQQYDQKLQSYIDYHNEYVGQTKFHLLMVFVELSREITKNTFKLMDEFDENYQKHDIMVRTKVKKQTIIPFNAVIEEDTARQQTLQTKIDQIETLSIQKESSRKSSVNKKYLDNEVTSIQNGQKEKYVVKQLIKVLFLQWTKSLCFRQKFMTELYRSLNKKRPSVLDEIFVTIIDIGGDPPEVTQLIPQRSEDSCIFDSRNYIQWIFVFRTRDNHLYKFSEEEISLKFSSLTGTLRLCYKPSQKGDSWFSFVGEPQMNITIEPTISNYNLSTMISISNDIMREFIIYKIKMLTFPNKEQIQVPLADFETEIPSNALQKIQEFVNRLKQ